MFGKHGPKIKTALAIGVMAATLGSSGCLLLAGGAAAGSAAGYAYYRGNVTQTVEGDFTTVWHASQDALYDLGMPVKKVSRDTMSGVLESENAAGEKVKISIDQKAPKIATDPTETEVGVRVATFGDQEVSKRIIQQITYRINAQGIANQPAVPAAQTNWRGPTSPAP